MSDKVTLEESCVMSNEEIFNKNIKIAFKLVQQYKNAGIELEDLKQMSLMGLWKAVITYKEDKRIHDSNICL